LVIYRVLIPAALIYGYKAFHARIAMAITTITYVHPRRLFSDLKTFIVISKKKKAIVVKTAAGIGPQNEPSGFTCIFDLLSC